MEASEGKSRSAAEVLDKIGEFLREDVKYSDSARVLKRSVDIRVVLLGDQHPDTLYSMDSLAISYSLDGKLAEAAELEEKVLEAGRRILGEEHPGT